MPTRFTRIGLWEGMTPKQLSHLGSLHEQDQEASLDKGVGKEDRLQGGGSKAHQQQHNFGPSLKVSLEQGLMVSPDGSCL